MKFHYLISLMIIFVSCKKSADNSITYSDSTHVHEHVKFNVAVTKQSQYDSMHNFTADSVIVNADRMIGNPDYLANTWMSVTLNQYFFTFSLDSTNQWNGNPTGIFVLTANMFPTINSAVKANVPYENTYTGNGANCPMYIVMHNGNGISIPRYFNNNVVPADAVYPPAVEAYSKITFTKITKYAVFSVANDTITVLDGNVSGYYKSNWGKTDPNKYVCSYTYNCDFSGVSVAQ